MGVLGFLYGVATFYGIQTVKKPLKRIAVVATSQMFEVMDRSREVAYNLKEGFEDMIAEAQYENLKRQQVQVEDEEELPMM